MIINKLCNKQNQIYLMSFSESCDNALMTSLRFSFNNYVDVIPNYSLPLTESNYNESDFQKRIFNISLRFMVRTRNLDQFGEEYRYRTNKGLQVYNMETINIF